MGRLFATRRCAEGTRTLIMHGPGVVYHNVAYADSG